MKIDVHKAETPYPHKWRGVDSKVKDRLAYINLKAGVLCNHLAFALCALTKHMVFAIGIVIPQGYFHR